MNIIIENGGTKLDWLIVGRNIINTVDTINLFDNDKIILNQINHIFPNELLGYPDIIIHFYSAGLTSVTEKKIHTILKQAFHSNSINVFSDMLAASRSLFNKRNGIACILGTGSNCAYFDGKKNHIITNSLGYLLGDEGSGYDLGRAFLIHYFHNHLPVDISLSFEKSTDLTKDELLSSVYTSSNPKFLLASFCPFLKEHKSNPFVKRLIQNCFLNFLINNPFKFSGFQNFKFGFVGGVAFHFRDILSEILDQNNINHIILEKPINSLMQYYID